MAWPYADKPLMPSYEVRHRRVSPPQANPRPPFMRRPTGAVERPDKRARTRPAYTPLALYLVLAFLVIAPLSISADAPLALKWTRLLLSMAACVAAIQSVQTRFLGDAARALTAFTLLHLCGALWSPFPIDGIFWKSFFAFSAFAGLLLATSLPDGRAFTRTLRAFGVVALFAGLVIVGVYLRNPTGNQVMGRLSVMGMNANNIGQAAAPMFLIALCLLVTDTTQKWKRLAIAAMVLAALVILGTGSRGAILACAAGGCVPLARMFQGKHVVFLAAAGMIIAVGVTVFQPGESVADVDAGGSAIGVGRLDTDLTKDTRSAYWRTIWNRARTAPLLGHGWFTPPRTPRSLNAMNIYLQAFYEEGVVGLLVLGWLVFVAVSCMRSALQMEKRFQLFKRGDPSALVASCLLTALFIHGLAESSTILGTTTSAMFLGFGLGLLDRHRVLYAQRPQLPGRRVR